MEPNLTNEANNEYANSNYTATELTELAFPYLIHAFTKGIEGRYVTSITVQRAGVESVKGFIRSVKDMGEPTESGYVAYTESPHVADVFGFFENSLAWGDMPWRTDRYHRNFQEANEKTRQGRTKVNLQ